MKKERVLRIAVNALGMLCAGLIMLTGVLLPAALLKKLERDNLSLEWPSAGVVVVQGSESHSPSTAYAEPLSSNEPRTGRLRAVLTAMNSNSSYPRDPLSGELSMNEAVGQARFELDQLIALNALPDFGPENFDFGNALLSEVSAEPHWAADDPLAYKSAELSPMGVWYVTFEHGSENVSIWLDAKTGAALRVILSLYDLGGPFELSTALFGFAKYYFGGTEGSFMGNTYEESSAWLLISGFDLSLFVYRGSAEEDVEIHILFDIAPEVGQSQYSEPEPTVSPAPTPTPGPGDPYRSSEPMPTKRPA